MNSFRRGAAGDPPAVLSPTVFADLPRNGDVARSPGAAAVLATPVARDSLAAAAQAVLGQPA